MTLPNTTVFVFGDSLSAQTHPYLGIVGVNPITDPTVSEYESTDDVPDIGRTAYNGYSNRTVLSRRSTNPPITLINSAIPGTTLTTSTPNSQAVIENRFYPMLVPSVTGTKTKLYILIGFHANVDSATPSVQAANFVTVFAGAQAQAVSAGVNLVCVTLPVPSRTDGAGFGESGRTTFNNTILGASWQATNNIIVPDYTNITSIYGVNAANDTTNFPDKVHWAHATAAQVATRLITTLNTIINNNAY